MSVQSYLETVRSIISREDDPGPGNYPRWKLSWWLLALSFSITCLQDQGPRQELQEGLLTIIKRLEGEWTLVYHVYCLLAVYQMTLLDRWSEVYITGFGREIYCRLNIIKWEKGRHIVDTVKEYCAAVAYRLRQRRHLYISGAALSSSILWTNRDVRVIPFGTVCRSLTRSWRQNRLDLRVPACSRRTHGMILARLEHSFSNSRYML